ncbi:MAG: electron transfer flavoprotein subunit beta/FixA family protein [Candidatus Bathyarchaeota archaeon]|nr:electron transfer flavoprotein subunit beta/FixA family protein [Candidatus Bathyarchaeota archaeon]
MTRIVVLVKDIPDLNEVKIDPSTRRPLVEGAKRRLNDLDKRALEAAIRMKEAGGMEVVTVSMGDERTKTCLLEALAMGADAAYIVADPALKGLDACATSRVLEAAIRKAGAFDVIVSGELSLDGMGSQVGPRVAELLDIPQVTYAKELKYEAGKYRAVRDLEDVDEVVEAEPPFLATVVREINEPRIPSLMNIMKAKKKPLTEWNVEALGLKADELKASIRVVVSDVKAPEVKRKRVMIKTEKVEEAVEKLVSALVAEGALEE